MFGGVYVGVRGGVEGSRVLVNRGLTLVPWSCLSSSVSDLKAADGGNNDLNDANCGFEDVDEEDDEDVEDVEDEEDDVDDLEAVEGVGDATRRGVGGLVGVVEPSIWGPYIDSGYSGVLARDIRSSPAGIYGILGVGGLSIVSWALSGSRWLKLIPG